MDAGLVEFVEKTVKSETLRAPDKPVYLIGESVGACVALAVAARNPDIDLVLILVNPGLAAISYVIYVGLFFLVLSKTHGLHLILQGRLSIIHSCSLSQHSWI